ncbi:MAG: hypothetical protein HN348_32100 [Proteobacteria bacterium]|jgi:hypothetical protein|nr:hypothetical protein [Pseudomonadota bacterium]
MIKRVTVLDVPEPLTLTNGPIVTDRPPPVRTKSGVPDAGEYGAANRKKLDWRDVDKAMALRNL